MRLAQIRLGRLMIVTLVVSAVLTASAVASRSPLPAKTAKLAPALTRVFRAEVDQGRGAAVAREQGLQVVRGRVRVVIEANGTRAAVASAVRTSGGAVEAWHAGLTQALVPPRALGPLSRSAAVAYVRAPLRLVTQ
jgi:hypothetical protein